MFWSMYTWAVNVMGEMVIIDTRAAIRPTAKVSQTSSTDRVARVRAPARRRGKIAIARIPWVQPRRKDSAKSGDTT